ncbi:L-threonine O-3-phosphate decarboxylase [Alteribacillus persepolensis]|uniref:Aminotransferase n=1 Tax=Alteribacillus persepolensis TaxID=568899 RepID=A0A1G7ZKS7_9BACI|nr:aminotransferase class I/II-fold pyridoxal phosphate-dependent enzyme [Alteribacillus persepolensis]SDH09313.1 L-threonine O-3-phosphate decarboxylase [Alteribacillus persepolensis]
MSWPEHGAMPRALNQQLQQDHAPPVSDFSVNTNPYGPPPGLQQQLMEWTKTVFYYSDPNHQQVRQHLAEKLDIYQNNVLPGNGGAELIFAAARLFANKKVVLMEPTFTEYKQALQANGADVISFQTTEQTNWQWTFEQIEPYISKADGIWLCHPNNPTGTAVWQEELQQLIDYGQQQKKWVVIDEAFYDFQEEPVSYHHKLRDNRYLLLLRSMTKMYAVPGLRLGYILAAEDVIHTLASFLPPWNMNSIAEKAMLYLLEQEDFVKNTVQQIEKEKQRVINELQQLDRLKVFPSAVNFYLLRQQDKRDVKPLLTYMAKEGLHARHTYHFPGLEGRYIRLAVKTEKENNQLLCCLTRWNHTC